MRTRAGLRAPAIGLGLAVAAGCAGAGASPSEGGSADPATRSGVAGAESPPIAPSQEASVMYQTDLRLSLHVSVDAGAAGPIDFELSLSNEGAEPRIVDFPDGQRYDFEVFDAGGALVWQWAADMNFIMMLGREQIPAGETLAWSQRLGAGLPAGAYRVVGTLTATEPASVETTFEVSTR